jgi:uncharacterized protein with FMN-binding domain
MRSSIKPLLGLAFAALGSVLVFGFRTTDSVLPATGQVPSSTTGKTASPTTAPTTNGGSSTANSGSTGSSSSARATPAPTQNASTPTGGSSSAQYADGTYQGAPVGEPWGTFEVEAIIKGGQLVDVKLVSEPGDRHSSQINNIAVPMLTQSALAAQSANVDLVSGATWTSESYAESLQSALDAAHAAALTSVQAAG